MQTETRNFYLNVSIQTKKFKQKNIGTCRYSKNIKKNILIKKTDLLQYTILNLQRWLKFFDISIKVKI